MRKSREEIKNGILNEEFVTILHNVFGDGTMTELKSILKEENKSFTIHDYSKENFDLQQVIGGYVMDEKGKIDWNDGEFTKAYRNGTYYIAENSNFMDRTIKWHIQDALKQNDIVLSSGEIVKKHPNFRFICILNEQFVKERI